MARDQLSEPTIRLQRIASPLPVVLPIELSASHVRPVAYRIFSKKHGLNLKSSGLNVLTEFLGHRFGVGWRSAHAERFLDEIARQWKEQDRGLFIEGPALQEIIRDITNKHEVVLENATVAGKLNTLTDDLPSKTVSFNWKDYFTVVNAQSQPLYRYDPVKKHFERSQIKHTLLGSANDLVSVFITRYHIVHDRVIRNETFQTPSFRGGLTASISGSNFYSITSIKNMLGRDSSNFLLFGLIVKGPDGMWWLQDTSGKVQLDTTQAVPVDGVYYTPGNFVMCDGIYFKDKFIVGTIGPPPSERREVSKLAYGNLDFLGVHTANSGNNSRIDRIDKNFEKLLAQQEKVHSYHRIIILGVNIFLDDIRTTDALRKFFAKLENEVDGEGSSDLPIAIIFPGSFKSVPFQANGSSPQYKESFDFLAKILGDFPSIASRCKLIFVPGDNDPWAAVFSSGATPLWPLESIPEIFTNRVRRVAQSAVWASNPCRLSYFSQEIVIVRDDYGSRFRRNCIHFNQENPDDAANESSEQLDMEVDETQTDMEIYEDSDSDSSNQRALRRIIDGSGKKIRPRTKPYVPPDVEEARKVVKTILDQGHLSPFPIANRPVAWTYDHTLSLSPLPSVLILADPTTPQFKATYEGCHVINPGPLLFQNKLNWMEYTPSRGTSEPKFIYV
jgi:DNA polymerase epsilon subunit 2